MKNKYNARKIEIDGIVFDSKKEGYHYMELKLLKQAGEIQDLVLQPSFLLQDAFIHDGKRIRKIEYKADFQYFDNKLGLTVIEDVKSKFTAKLPVYRLKVKILKFKYPDIYFQEVI